MLSKRFAVLAALGAATGIGRVNAEGSSAQAMAISPAAVYSDIEIKDDGDITLPDGTKVYFHGESTSAADCDSNCEAAWPPVTSSGGSQSAVSSDSRFTRVINGQLHLDGRPLYTCALSDPSNCDNNDHWPEATYSILSSISSGCSGLPARSVAFKISPSQGAGMCSGTDEIHVRCDTDIPYVKLEDGVLSYTGTGEDWEIKDVTNKVVFKKTGGAITFTDANGASRAVVLPSDYSVNDADFIDLSALNTELDAGVTIDDSCDVFSAASNMWDLQSAADSSSSAEECDEIGNINAGMVGSCSASTISANRCVSGYVYDSVTSKCKAEEYASDASTTDKKLHARNVRMGNAGTAFADNAKKKYKAMRENTRAYQKSLFDIERAKSEHNGKKAHELRKLVRMPLSIAGDSEDFKPALRDKLRLKFGLGSGEDRDVGIIVGPENDIDDIECKDGMSGKAEYTEILDSQNCITYDAAIDEHTTDVHVLGSDESYNIGGIQIGGKYVPVVKQTLADKNANPETFEMSCWTGSAWEVQDSAYVAGNEVSCTVSRSGIAVKVDTIVGSTATGLVDGDKCDVGYGCADTDDNDACDLPFSCVPCEIPEANNDVDKTVCEAQLCEAGTGYNAPGVVFNPNLNPQVQDNANCGTCQDGTYNTGSMGQCVPYSTCAVGYEHDSTHDSKEEDAPCVDVKEPTITSGATATIEENSGMFQEVYEPIANDNSGDLTFALGGADASEFTFDAAAGEVILDADPDFETKPSYSFTVVAFDDAGNEATKVVTLSIINVDEVAPVITSGGTADAIDENSGAGQGVYTATADDSADISDGVTFSLGSGSDAALSIDPAAGEVTLNADPDFETKPSYSFTVVATDAAGNVGSAQAVTLIVNNVDEVAPTITSLATATAIVEGTNPNLNKVVYTASADDSADVSATPITFSLGSGSDAALSIDSATGAVTLTENPDYDTKSSYSFTVVATDNAGNVGSKLVTLTVLEDQDGDGANDQTDTCVYTGCSVQQLTDAYALLTSADACSGSRRTHTHTNIDGCKTAGCASEVDAIKDAFELKRTQCSAT